MSESRDLVVDVKTPLDAYLEALEAGTDEERQQALKKHAQQVDTRVRQLASKAYWAQFERSPEFVVLFLPGDQFLSAALAERPELYDTALKHGIIIATPSTLIALLKTVAYGWRQSAMTENAKLIRELGQELYRRLGAFTGHLEKLGARLGGAVDAYNASVGSLERQVLPQARRFPDLGVTTDAALPELGAIEQPVRPSLPPSRAMSEKPEADTPRFLAWLYSTPAQQPVLASALRDRARGRHEPAPGADTRGAHAARVVARGVCALRRGSPAHPLTRELRVDAERLVPAARVDSVLAELSGLTDTATWDLASAIFERRAELTAYCRRWAAAMVAPLVATLAAPEVDWIEFGAALRELELLGHLARDARAGRVRIPLDELEQAAVAPRPLRHRHGRQDWSVSSRDVIRICGGSLPPRSRTSRLHPTERPRAPRLGRARVAGIASGRAHAAARGRRINRERGRGELARLAGGASRGGGDPAVGLRSGWDGRCGVLGSFRQKRLQLLGRELAVVSARERALQRQGAEPRAQHPADDRALALEELAYVLAARAARDDRIPAVGTLPARAPAAEHGQLLAAVEHATEDAFDLLLDQLPADPDAEFARERAHRALQTRSELAISAYELEAAVDTRHGADHYESPPGALRQAGKKRHGIRSVGRRSIHGLTRRAVIDVGAATRLRRTLADHTAVEPYLIVGTDTDPERSG